MLGIIKKYIINNKFFIILSLLCFILLLIFYSKTHIIVEGYSNLEEAYNDLKNKEALLDSKNNELNSINLKINSLNKDYDDGIKIKKPKLEKDLDAARIDYNNANTAVVEAEEYERKKSKDRGDKKSRNRHDNAKKDRDNKRATRDIKEAEMNKIKKELDDIPKIKDNIDKENINKKNIEDSIKTTKNEIATATSKIQQMQSDVNTVTNHLNSLNKDYDDGIKAKKKLEDEKNSLEDELKTAEKAVKEAEEYERKKSKDRGDKKSRNRHDNAKKARDDKRAIRDEIKAKLDKIIKDIDNKTNDIKKIKDNIDKVNSIKPITTPSPTTRKPTTPKPTTRKPTTPKPTTPKPTTPKLTTPKPTTLSPSTLNPTTLIPTKEKNTNTDVIQKEYNFEKPPIDYNNTHWSQTNNIMYLQEGMTSTIAPPNVDNIANSEYIISSLLSNPEITSYYSLITYGTNWTKADLITTIKSILENNSSGTSSLSRTTITLNSGPNNGTSDVIDLPFLSNFSKNTNKMTITDINGNPYEFLNYQQNQPNGTDGNLKLELENQSIKQESEITLNYNIPKNVTTDSNGNNITLNTGSQKCKYRINCTEKHYYRPNCSTVINKNGDCDCSCNDQIIFGSGEAHSHCISEDLSSSVFHYLSGFKNIQINVPVPSGYSSGNFSSGTVTYDPDIGYLCELIADYYILLLYNKEKINLSYEKQQSSNTKEQSYHDANYLYQSDYIKMVNISVGILGTIYIMYSTINK